MPISSFHGLQTSLRGLLAHQRALDVTGHNVANADTEGYTRQEAILAPTAPLRVQSGVVATGGAADLGSGVDALSYRRIRDTFLDLQFRAQNLRLGGHGARARSLEQAELALGEPGDDGLSALLNKFWSAWGDVANNPENPAARQALVDQGGAVAEAFADLDAKFAAAAAQTMQDYAALTAPGGEVDQLAREIATLNDAISRSVSAGGQPNDLLDRRDLLLDRLSALGQVSVTELASGSTQVAFGDAAALLVNDTTVNWPQALTAATGGRLGGMLAVAGAGGTIASYRADLAASARALADTVNAIHNGGTGVDFFSYAAGNEAATLAVAVGAAGVRAGSTASPGANDVALAIAGLRGGTADDRYLALVSRIGTDVRETFRLEANARTLTNAVNERRQSAGGVSLDEEMANLVRFQRGYQASARAMSTIDELLDVLINRTGRVGL